MPRFAANLTLLFTELPFVERFAAAARAGFAAVECQFPYDWPKETLASALVANRLQMVLHNLPAGDWAAGDRGSACQPDRVAEFRAGVAQAIAYAQALGCSQLNCIAGVLPPGLEPARARQTLVENLRFAAAELARADIRLLLEPINTRDIPGFLVSRTDDALALLDEVGAPNLFLQYDIYHAQRTEGELGATLAAHLPRIAHLQVADNPGRHEPGTGEINFPWLFARIDRLGYTGWIGCEYRPASTTEAGLGWLQAVGGVGR